MVVNSAHFKTKKGIVALSVNPVDLESSSSEGTVSMLSAYDFTDNSDKDWGLATKFYVLSTIDSHNNDSGAHANLFGSILSSFEDIVTSSGSFCFNTIRDENGNYIKANGMAAFKNGSDIGYVVLSKSKFSSFDDLSAYVVKIDNEAKTELAKKQNVLIEGDNIQLNFNPVTNKTTISATDTKYTLPEATETTIGGVRLDSELTEGSVNPVKGCAIYAAIERKQNKINGSDSIYINEDGTAGINFGTIMEGETKAVDGASINSKLASKQKKIGFSSSFTSSDGVVSLNFAEVTSGIAGRPVDACDVNEQISTKQNKLLFSSAFTTSNSIIDLNYGDISENESKPVSNTAVRTELVKKQKHITYSADFHLGKSESDEITSVGIEYVPISSSGSGVVSAGAIFDALTGKKDTFTFNSSDFIETESEGGVTVGLNYGNISEGGVNPVSCSAALSALTGKQDAFEIDTSYFSLTSTTPTEVPTLSVITSSIAENSNRLVSGGEIFEYYNKISGSYALATVTASSTTSGYVLNLYNHTINSSYEQSPSFSSVSAIFPIKSGELPRDFIIFRKLDVGVAVPTLVFPSIDSDGYTIKYFTTGDNPFSTIYAPSITEYYQYYVTELGANTTANERNFMVGRKKLQVVSAS